MPKSFEDFPVYKKILLAIKEIELVCNSIKLIQFIFIKDQIRRASSSVLLNLAEGSIKWGKKDKVNFYRMSGASACECIAALDLLKMYGLIEEEKANDLKHQFREISASIQALIISIQRRI